MRPWNNLPQFAPNFSQLFHKFFGVLGCFQTRLDAFGYVWMHSDTLGCVRMRLEAFARNQKFFEIFWVSCHLEGFRMFSESFREVFGRLSGSFFGRFSGGFREVFERFSGDFREGFGRFLESFREVFGNFSASCREGFRKAVEKVFGKL